MFGITDTVTFTIAAAVLVALLNLKGLLFFPSMMVQLVGALPQERGRGQGRRGRFVSGLRRQAVDGMSAERIARQDGEASAAGVAEGQPWKLRFGAIFMGQALSLTGSALTQFVLLWWITDTTGSAAALGAAALAALLPQALLGPLGGTLADRYSRRWLMAASDLVSAACMAVLIALFLTQRVQLWHIYAMLAVRSAMQAFQQPAAAASTAMLVPGYFLPRAAGLNQSLMGIMTVGAPPLGALAMSAMPLGWALAIDVATALLGIAPLLFFTIPQPRAARGGGWRSLWREWREGVQAVWRHAALRQLYALIGAAVMCVMPLFTLVPLLVKTHFAGGANQVALMESLSGIGMIAGGAFVAAFAPQRRMRWFLWGFALSGLTMALTALAPADQFGLGAAFWLSSGLTFAVGNAPFMAMLQSAVPNHLQGRVLSLLNTLIGLAGPVGLALAAPLGEALGSRWLFVLLGACGGLVMLLGFASRALRRMEQGESGGPAGS